MAHKIAFLFSGQGAQKPGMGKSLYDGSPAARAVFAQTNDACGKDIAALCFDGTPEELAQTQHTQPAVLAVDMAAWAAACEAGLHPRMTAGFSLGEYAALTACGALEVPAAFHLISRRAHYMAACGEGGMLAVLGMENGDLEAMCAGIGQVWPVNYNAPGQTVVAGAHTALTALREELKARKVKAIPLAVGGAFHSPLMAPAARQLAVDLAQATFRQPTIPMVFNATGTQGDRPVDELMRMQCMSPVYWTKTIGTLLELGADAFVECGPGGVLTGLCKRICPDVACYRIEDAETLQVAVAGLLG